MNLNALASLIERIQTTEIDKLPEIDSELATLLGEAEPDDLFECFEKISMALAQNKNITLPGSPDSDVSGLNPGSNWVDNRNGAHSYGDAYSTSPSYVGTPGSLSDMRTLINSVPDGNQVDVVATGMSTNMVFAQKSAYLLDISHLNNRLDFETGIYKSDPGNQKYYRTEAGVAITKMLDDINSQSLALRWAGYTPQSAIGAITTSSVKSGFLPPITDFVLSYDVIYNDGKIYRIEPSNGITDATAYREFYKDGREIIQDDETFYGSLVLASGAIYSLILQGSERYCLAFEKVFFWDIHDARSEIERILKLQCTDRENERHPKDWQLDVWVAPKSITSKQTLLVKHDIIEYKELPPRDPPGGIWGELIKLFWATAWIFPNTTDLVINNFLFTQAQGREELDWRHFLGFSVPEVGTMFANKFAIPYKGDENTFDDTFIKLIDEISTAMRKKWLRLTAPVTFRFGGASKHRLGLSRWPDQGQRVVAIETPMIPHGAHTAQLVRYLDGVRKKYGGRSHFGLTNLLEEDPGSLGDMYGSDVQRARDVRAKLLGSKPSPFGLHRVLRPNPVGFIDPDRYYFIRFEFLGFEFVYDASGYVGITENDQFAQAQIRQTGSASHNLMWRFVPHGNKPNQYQIFSRTIPGKWTVHYIGGLVRQNANRIRQEEGENVFTIDSPPGNNGAWRISRENGEAMIVTLHPSIVNFVVSWSLNTPNDHLLWLEDAGPIPK